METLKNIVSDIRTFMYGGITTLPLTLAGTLSILGLFTANYAILFFLIGYLILVPIIASIIDFLFSGANIFKASTSDICRLVIPFSTRNSPVGTSEQNVLSSSWTAMIAFFIGYIFTNALELYNREAEDTQINVTTSDASDISNKVTNRKSQAIIAMISIIVFGAIVFGFRYYTGCESWLGMGITISLFIMTGHGWYKALSSIGEDRLSDMFGIANRLLPPSAISNAPIACIPIQN
jgi:hypothetical protein